MMMQLIKRSIYNPSRRGRSQYWLAPVMLPPSTGDLGYQLVSSGYQLASNRTFGGAAPEKMSDFQSTTSKRVDSETKVKLSCS